MKKWLHTALFLFLAACVFTQHKPKLEFDGQLSLLSSYAPDNDLQWFTGARYLPELNLDIPLDSNHLIDFEASANLSGSIHTLPFDSADINGDINPYRAWARYSTRQFELRIGLQKIDFGSATLLRPLQWFNQIDPRDPLQLTNGVYGALGRYYFLNNANIWLWGLYGNERRRGFDAVETNPRRPEYGGRIQYPTPRGEFAFSYHHRTANSMDLPGFPQYEILPEDRFALDGKWDMKVGLWFEAAYIRKSRDLGILSHQTLLNVGTDYTFGIGNGFNLVLEHLLVASDQNPFQFAQTAQVSATTLTYPLGLFDNLLGVVLYNWTSEDFTFFLNYQRQFKRFTGYLMAFYNPDIQSGILQNELVNQFSGPGIRVMLVFDH